MPEEEQTDSTANNDNSFASTEQVVGIGLLFAAVTLLFLGAFGMLEHPLSLSKLNLLIIAATTLIIGERAVSWKVK